MYTIEKDFAFSASHQLEGLPTGHQCGRLHGHNYVVRVRLSGRDLDRHGFILDYGELAPVGRWIDDHMDHRHLNDALSPFLGPNNTTAERLAAMLTSVIYDLLHTDLGDNIQVAVGVSETPKTWSWYHPENGVHL